MKLKDILGICMYNWYGGGGHSSIGKLPLSVSGTELINADGKEVSTIRAISNFKLHRAFVDNWIVVPEAQPPFTLKVQPTEQNFYFDDYFALQKANGIRTIWSASGCFDWYVPFLGGKSQRKTACYDPRLSPTDPNAWKDLAQLCKLIAERYKDNGLVDYIQVLNEWDFRWNVPHILTPEEYAVGFYECYKAIRSVSATQKMMVGCTLTPELATFTRLFTALDILSSAEGKPKVRDVTVTFNLYSRTQSVNQGEGIGATFEEVNQYGRFLKPLNDWCKQEGLKWGMTESGHNSSPSSSFAAMKNKAPLLEGYTLEQSQGILTIRTALICASLSECIGITFYHTKDGYEAEPFTYHGFNYDKDFGGKEDWSAKPARTICEEFLAKYGEMEVDMFGVGNGVYYVYLNDGDNLLVWTDKNNDGRFTPFPTDHFEIPTPQPMLTIQNNRLHKDGQPFFIKEANSPETILRTNISEFKAIVDYWASVGINCLYASCMAGDKYKSTLHPFINLATPSQGFNQTVLNDWKSKLEYAVSKGFILHLLLSEKENHYALSETDHKAYIDKMVETFGHLPVIWDREELDENKADYINLYYGYLKSKSNGIRAIHNNTNENPWRGFENSDLIQFISFQEWEGNFDSRIKTEVPKGTWAGYSSEVTGGFQPTDTALAAKIRDAGGNLSSGAGVYIPVLDQDATLAQLKTYDAVYKTISSQVVTPPNPTTMKIGYSTKADRSDFKEFVNGQSLPTGNYYIEAREVVAPVVFSFSKDNAIIKQQTENGQPYDLYGGQPYSATNGSYQISVSDKNNQSKSIFFTVGTFTPPPTGDIAGTSFALKPNGQIEFTFTGGVKKLVNTI